MVSSTTPTGPTRDHNGYIGGSDIAAVVGQSRFKTQLDVWAEKTGRTRFGGNEWTEFGDHFERPILALYSKRHKLVESDLIYPGTLTHPLLQHLAATPDAIVGSNHAVQVKCVGLNARALRDLWGDPQDGPEAVPVDVALQVTWETGIARKVLGIKGEVAHIVAMLGTDLPTYEVPFDAEMFEALETVADEFWRKHIAPDVMPEVVGDDGEILRRIFPRIANEKVLAATPEVIELVRAYVGCRQSEGCCKKDKERIGAQLCALIGDGFGFVSPEHGIKVTWGEKQGSVSWKDVAKEFRHHAVLAGVNGAVLDMIEHKHRGQPTRVIDVRVKETST
jgi:YqaJ-like viral recombinase domain